MCEFYPVKIINKMWLELLIIFHWYCWQKKFIAFFFLFFMIIKKILDYKARAAYTLTIKR